MRSYAEMAAVCVLAIGLVWIPAEPAHAARKKSQTTASTSPKAGHRAKRAKNSSQETTAERDRRLKRECKGLPNAGACLGYANQ